MSEYIYDECVEMTQEDLSRIFHTFRDRLPLRGFMRVYQDNFVERMLEQKREEEIAKRYHELCDAYDRIVCTGKSTRTGEPMPVTPREQGLIDRYSQQVRNDLMQEYALTDEQFHEIITGVCHDRTSK